MKTFAMQQRTFLWSIAGTALQTDLQMPAMIYM
jgi:hypothetical protein